MRGVFNVRMGEEDWAALERMKARLGMDGASVVRQLLHAADADPDVVSVGHPAPAQVPVSDTPKPVLFGPQVTKPGARLDKGGFLRGKGIK